MCTAWSGIKAPLGIGRSRYHHFLTSAIKKEEESEGHRENGKGRKWKGCVLGLRTETHK